MRVAVVTRYFPTSAKPWEGHSAYETLRALTKLCDVHVFCPVPRYQRFLKPKVEGAPVDLNWAPHGVDATYVTFPILPLLSRPLNGYIMARSVMRRVIAYQPDVILSYTVYPDGFAAVDLGRRIGVPAVLVAIGSDLNRISGRFSRVMTVRALRGAAAIVTVSHDLRDTALRMGANPETTKATLNGCDTSIFQPRDRTEARRALGLEPDADIVLYVGRLDLRKGLMEMVDAAAALAPKRSQLRCYIVGEGPAREALQQAIAGHGLQKVITLVPPCPTEVVAQWMAAANLLTLPSYNEGCPNVVIEALSTGRPIVATRVGGIPELMDETSGKLVSPRDVDALTTALDEVLSQTWDEAGIARLHSRSWDYNAEDLLAVFNKVIS